MTYVANGIALLGPGGFPKDGFAHTKGAKNLQKLQHKQNCDRGCYLEKPGQPKVFVPTDSFSPDKCFPTSQKLMWELLITKSIASSWSWLLGSCLSRERYSNTSVRPSSKTDWARILDICLSMGFMDFLWARGKHAAFSSTSEYGH